MRLYIVSSEDGQKALDGFYAKSDLKAIIPFKQYCIMHKIKAQLNEVMNNGKLRRIYG